MSWLLDTHVFIWFEIAPNRLPRPVYDLLATTDDPVYVSTASFWEIAIKRRLGKLDFTGSPRAAARASGFLVLPIGAEEAEATGDLPWTHRDPFDRKLAAQSLVHELTLVSADVEFRAVPQLSLYWREQPPV